MNYKLAFRADAAGRPESIGLFVAQCQETDIANDGATWEETVAALKEALALYFEPTPTVVARCPDSYQDLITRVYNLINRSVHSQPR